MNSANLLTLSRIFISPLFFIIYSYYGWLGLSVSVVPFILLGFLVLSELSDLFDGYLARRYHQVTEFGKIFDPAADSIARISVFLTLTQGPVHLPLWMILVFIYRDSLIGTLRTICATKGYTLAARPSGKRKAVIQGVMAIVIVAMLVPYNRGVLEGEDLMFWSAVLVGVAALYTVYSGIEYIYVNRRCLRLVLSVRRKRVAKQTGAVHESA